jgi:predicted dienelactone hydrolase
MRTWAVSAAILLFFARVPPASVGFEQVSVPDPEGKPLVVGVWYPSDAQPSPHPVGLFSQTVAANGGVAGNRLALVLISHGTFGSLASHHDTAIALARTGFVVAAVTHTGDNDRDQSDAGNRHNLIDRPRQIKHVLDYMLSAWPAHAQLDADRIGVFGFSLGGFTALVEIGGVPDLRRMALHCSTHVDAPECAFIKQRHGDQLDPVATEPVWVHDARIKAAVVAAPAVSLLFESGGLRQITVPVQLWRAADDDQVPDQWNTAIVRRELQARSDEHVVPAAGHYVFLAPCSDALAKVAPQICQDGPGFSRGAFHEAFNRAVADFFGRTLRARSS